MCNNRSPLNTFGKTNYLEAGGRKTPRGNLKNLRNFPVFLAFVASPKTQKQNTITSMMNSYSSSANILKFQFWFVCLPPNGIIVFAKSAHSEAFRLLQSQQFNERERSDSILNLPYFRVQKLKVN